VVGDKYGQIPPNGLREKPNTVLEGERVPHDTGETHLGRRPEFHCTIAPEHQVMVLEGAFRNHLTYFLEIDPRCDAQSLKRGQERERLSTIHIGDRTANPYREVRTANPYREVELDHGPALLLLRIFITTSALSLL
jgi:hypothetical protein